MPHEPIKIVYVDPRSMDGDVFDVAERACRQAAGLARLLEQALEGVELMVRNAEMDRQKKPDPLAWENGPQGRLLAKFKEDVIVTKRQLLVLASAAGYDPKNPPKE